MSYTTLDIGGKFPSIHRQSHHPIKTLAFAVGADSSDVDDDATVELKWRNQFKIPSRSPPLSRSVGRSPLRSHSTTNTQLALSSHSPAAAPEPCFLQSQFFKLPFPSLPPGSLRPSLPPSLPTYCCTTTYTAC